MPAPVTTYVYFNTPMNASGTEFDTACREYRLNNPMEWQRFNKTISWAVQEGVELLVVNRPMDARIEEITDNMNVKVSAFLNARSLLTLKATK